MKKECKISFLKWIAEGVMNIMRTLKTVLLLVVGTILFAFSLGALVVYPYFGVYYLILVVSCVVVSFFVMLYGFYIIAVCVEK